MKFEPSSEIISFGCQQRLEKRCKTLIQVNSSKLLAILRSDTASQITPLSRESFYTPLWRTFKNSGRAGNGRDRL